MFSKHLIYGQYMVYFFPLSQPNSTFFAAQIPKYFLHSHRSSALKECQLSGRNGWNRRHWCWINPKHPMTGTSMVRCVLDLSCLQSLLGYIYQYVFFLWYMCSTYFSMMGEKGKMELQTRGGFYFRGGEVPQTEVTGKLLLLLLLLSWFLLLYLCLWLWFLFCYLLFCLLWLCWLRWSCLLWLWVFS